MNGSIVNIFQWKSLTLSNFPNLATASLPDAIVSSVWTSRASHMVTSRYARKQQRRRYPWGLSFSVKTLWLTNISIYQRFQLINARINNRIKNKATFTASRNLFASANWAFISLPSILKPLHGGSASILEENFINKFQLSMVLHTGHQLFEMQLYLTLIYVVLLLGRGAFHQGHDHWHAFHQMLMLGEDQSVRPSKMHSLSKGDHN